MNQPTAIDGVKVHGFFRIQISKPDAKKMEKLSGDSGWCKNQVVNLGFQDYLSKGIAGASGAKTITHIALGTGGAPGATDTSLAGEIMSSTQRKTASTSIISSRTIQFTAAFASSDSFLSAAANLSNVGLFNTTSTNATLFAGNTFTSSSCNTNQNVNVTYQIRFS